MVTENTMTASTVWCHGLDYTNAPAVLPPQMTWDYYENSFFTDPQKSLKDPRALWTTA